MENEKDVQGKPISNKKDKIKKYEDLNSQIAEMSVEKFESNGLFNPIKGAYDEIESDYYILPDGLLLNGSLHKEIRLKALSSITRKKISKNSILKNPPKVVDVELVDCIIDIKGINKIDENIVRKLTDIDRNFCQYVIQNLTYGCITTDVTCNNCQSNITIETDLSDIEVKELPQEIQNNIVNGERLWTFYKEGIGVVRFKLLNGDDVHEMFKYVKAGNVDREDLLRLISASVFDFNGIPIMHSHVERWPIKVVDWVEECMDSMNRGIDPFVKQECSECGEVMQYIMDVQSFLFLNPQSNSKKRLMHLTK